MTRPDYDRAATAAAEVLIKHNIVSAPVMPLPILKTTPGVIVLSFAEMANKIGLDRTSVISAFVAENRDVITSVRKKEGKLHYVMAYNMRLPFYMLQRSLARELAHIILGHDGSLPVEVRQEEALVFARHLICPRPLIKAMQDAGISITIETFGNVTGCYESCLKGMQKTPGTNVPADLNRAVRKQFEDYVQNLIDCQPIKKNENSTPVDFGSYMDCYIE